MSALKIDFIFLLKAIKENRNIHIFKKSRHSGQQIRFFSRFFQIQQPDKIAPKTLLIDLPYLDGTEEAMLKSGDSIQVVFHESGFRFQFETMIAGTVEIRGLKGAYIPALMIQWPKTIIDGNRRSMFRASVNLRPFPKVSYFILEKTNGSSRKTFLEFDGIEALMIDISETGTAIQIGDDKNLEVGDRIKLIFLLEEQKQLETELEGIVRNIREIPETKVHICGIQFDQGYVDHYKGVLRDIACYVMAIDRKHVDFFKINQMVSQNPYVHKIVNHEVSEEVLDMLVKRELPLSDFEFLESLVYAMDSEIHRDRVLPLLKDIPASLKKAYIKKNEANHKVARYILDEAIGSSHFQIISEILNNPYFPIDFMKQVATTGTPRMLKILLANKVRLIANPTILTLIEKNRSTTDVIKREIKGVRDIYIKSRETFQISEKAVMENIRDLSPDDWIVGAENSILVPDKPKVAPPKGTEIKPKLLSMLKDINKLSLHQRIKLAFAGSKAERIILSKDKHPMIQQALIENTDISEEEIIEIIQQKDSDQKLINALCDHKRWSSAYKVIWTLLHHRKVKLVKAADFILKLKDDDLKILAKNEQIHPTVRQFAKSHLSKLSK